jgi:hypothetical protein
MLQRFSPGDPLENFCCRFIFPALRDQTSRATQAASPDTSHRAAQKSDSECAPQSHTKNHRIRAARCSARTPKPSKLHPAAAEYARTPPTGQAVSRPQSSPRRYPAVSPAARALPAFETCLPAAAQIETKSPRGLRRLQNARPDDTIHNARRKKEFRAGERYSRRYDFHLDFIPVAERSSCAAFRKA